MAKSGSVNTSAYSNRYLTLSWTQKIQSIENNKTVISWTLNGAGSQTGYYKTRNIKLTLNGSTVYSFAGSSSNYVSLYNGTEVASGEFTIVHDVEGKAKLDVYIEAGIYVWEVNCTGSDRFELETIPRASTLTVDNGTLGMEQTLEINSASTSFKHRLAYRCGDTSGYVAGSASSYSTATSISWAPPIGLAAENTAGTSVSITLTLYTYTDDGTHVGTTTETITCVIPTSVKPVVSIAWEDTTGAVDTYGSPVQCVSKIKVTLTAQASYESPIVRYSIGANGVEYASATATTEALRESGSQKIVATVKDKRGRSGSNNVTLDVLAYTAPILSKLTVHRCNEDGTENDRGSYVKAIFSAAVTDLIGKNPATYVLRYGLTTEDSYTEVELTALENTYTVTDYEYIFAADSNGSYNVEVEAADNHGTATRATTASTAFTLMNFHYSGTGLGVGKVSEKEYAVEFDLDLYDKNNEKILGVNDLRNLFYPIGSIILRYDHTDPGTIYGGTWTRLSNYLLRGIDEDDTIGETGTIGSGSGQTFIDVSIWRRTA